jgi:hypothetical protein
VLILIHLRHFPVAELLAAMFECSRMTARNTQKRLLKYLYDKLHHLISLRSLEYRMEHGCVLFYTMYTFLIDGTEQFVSSSNNPFLDTEFYSVKKKHHTVNIIIVSTINNKKILYLSYSQSGMNNDEKISLQTKSEWHDKLTSIEHGIGDHGYDGLDKYGMRIDTPGGKNDKFSHILASKRIAIENLNADLKDWRSIRDEIRMKLSNKEDLLETHFQQWTVVAVFHIEYRDQNPNKLR